MAALIQGILKSLKIVGEEALNPTLLVLAFTFLAYGLPHLIVKITGSEFIPRWLEVFGLKAALKVSITLGIGHVANRIQNLRARKAIVLALVRKGVRVAVLDVADFPPDLAQIDSVFYWKCNIASASSVAAVADSIRDTMGHPSILINNAGMANRSSILDVTPEEASKLFGVNLMALWYTVKAFLPNMILDNKGHVVTVASMSSFSSLPTAVDYSASKAGALAFHEGLASEIKHLYKAPGVLTTVAHLMWVDTNMTKDRQEAIERSSGNKMMKPEEVAQVVADQIFSRHGAQLIIPPSVT